MLVLKRHWNERIVIDGGIVLTLVDAGEGWAKIGIDAPPQIAIAREEILDQPRRHQGTKEEA